MGTGPSHGTLSGTAPNVTYTPLPNYNGPDSFSFTVNDGTLTSAPATVSITVTPVNDPPTALAQSVSTPEDTAKAITLAGSDPDGGALTFAIGAAPAHGTLSGTANNVTYTPAPDYNGPDSFTFTVNDGAVTSAAATVTITVTPVDDPPVVGQPGLTPLPTVIKRYAKYKRAKWLKTPAVRLPATTTLGQPVTYVTLTKGVCKPVLTKGIWRIKGQKGGKCILRATAPATATAAALDLTFTVIVKRK